MPVRNSNRRGSRGRERSTLVGMAMLSGAIVLGAVLMGARTQEPREAPTASSVVVAQFDTVSLPVPISAVPAGTKVKDIRFRNASFPSHQVPEGAIRNIAEHVDSLTVAALPASLPLFEDNLNDTFQGNNPVLEGIPPGMRAMTLKVDATSAVEGWAGSGSFVDVLLVEKNRTTVVAEMVKVLSAERSVSPVEGTAAPSVPTTVTVLVSQEQCLAINTAIPIGKIAFALRGTKDKERWTSTTFTADSLKGSALLKDQRGTITGFVAAKNEQNTTSFALTDGKWIATKVIPDGFFAGTVQRRNDVSAD